PGEPDTSDPHAVARLICLRLLERRARSRAELAAQLRRRGVPDDAARTVLDRFTEVGLIDDAALAGMLAGAHHRERGLARRAVTLKLRQRGLDEQLVAEAVGAIDADSERHAARRLVAKRLPALAALAPEVRARRLVALLARRGYPGALAWEVVRDAVTGPAGLEDADPGPGG
ncbi:MAG: regulatory protein RecX, partial [Jatrophihabitans sp.]